MIERVDAAKAELLVNAINQDGTRVDIYRVLAAQTFGVPEADVTAEQRRWAKTELFKHLYTPPPLRTKS